MDFGVVYTIVTFVAAVATIASAIMTWLLLQSKISFRRKP